MLPGMRIRRGLRPIALIGLLAIVAGLGVPADRPRRRRRPRGRAALGARRLALRPARDRVRRRTRRRREPAGRRALRAPLPVPRGRREHRQRLGDLEHQRRLREVVRPGLGRQRHGRGVPVLPDAPELARDRRRRVREGPQQPQERLHDGRLLGRRPAVHAEGRGRRIRAPGGAARRARPVGLHRAGRHATTTRRTCRRPSPRAATPTSPASPTPPSASPRRSSSCATCTRRTSCSPITRPCGGRCSTSTPARRATPRPTSSRPRRRPSTAR